MPDAAFDVLVGIEGVRDTEARRRSWHQLHQTLSASPRNGARVELGFRLDDRRNQNGRNVVSDGHLSDVGLDLDDLRDLGAGFRGVLARHLHGFRIRRREIRLRHEVRWDDGEQQDAEPQHVARERRHRVALREASDRRFHSAQEILRVWSLANGIPGVVVA